LKFEELLNKILNLNLTWLVDYEAEIFILGIVIMILFYVLKRWKNKLVENFILLHCGTTNLHYRISLGGVWEKVNGSYVEYYEA